MGRLLPLPERREPVPGERERTCFRCIHATFPDGNTHCTKHDEPVDSELYAARECDDYTEHDPRGTTA